MLTGEPPFQGETIDEIINDNKECDLSKLFSRISDKISPSSIDLLKLMLQID